MRGNQVVFLNCYEVRLYPLRKHSSEARQLDSQKNDMSGTVLCSYACYVYSNSRDCHDCPHGGKGHERYACCTVAACCLYAQWLLPPSQWVFSFLLCIIQCAYKKWVSLSETSCSVQAYCAGIIGKINIADLPQPRALFLQIQPSTHGNTF